MPNILHPHLGDARCFPPLRKHLLWVKPESLTKDSSVAVWADVSGNVCNLVANSRQPTLSMDVVNNFDVVRFERVSEALLCKDVRLTVASTHIILSRLKTQTDWHLTITVRDSGGIRIWEDGALVDKSDAPLMRFQEGAGALRGFEGDVAEVIVYNYALNDSHIDSVIAYINQKYHLNFWRKFAFNEGVAVKWKVPAAWDNLNNCIECGGGDGGGSSVRGGPAGSRQNGRAGGGAGIALVHNRVIEQPSEAYLTYTVGRGGLGGLAAGAPLAGEDGLATYVADEGGMVPWIVARGGQGAHGLTGGIGGGDVPNAPNIGDVTCSGTARVGGCGGSWTLERNGRGGNGAHGRIIVSYKPKF